MLDELNEIVWRLGPNATGKEWHAALTSFLERYGVEVAGVDYLGDDINNIMSLYKKISDR